jgi:alkylation response protein AidB-like acyl-CoA dehydrogenase
MGTDRHEGLSQLIVDLHAAGVTINPILSIDGRHHFNEVVFDNVLVSDDMMLGEEGSAWAQVTSELAFERSGPDRFLSLWPLVRSLIDEGLANEQDDEIIGQISSRFFTLRQLSLSVARALEEGRDASVEAALVKDLGTQFEQWLALAVQSVLESSPDPGSASLTESLLAAAILAAPAFTIRGGTTEVLRSIVAQALRAA